MYPQGVLDRFWAKVNKGPDSDCWQWTSASRGTYGGITINDKSAYAHRVSWEIHYGPIPPGMFVCHHCDNRLCVNPNHLFLGTPDDNMQDAKKKGRLVHSEESRRTRGLKTRKLSPEQVAEIAAIHVPHRNTAELAQRYGVCRQTIRTASRGTAQSENAKRSWRDNKALRDISIVADYQAGGTSMEALAHKYGVNISTVSRVIAKNGVPSG